VRVIAGGNLVADGELVAVGDGFGVLVTSVRSGQAG
jgi:flagellar motor switch/type III secretory pathway protein FliN